MTQATKITIAVVVSIIATTAVIYFVGKSYKKGSIDTKLDTNAVEAQNDLGTEEI